MNTPGLKVDLLGRCFKVQSSYGDDRAAWTVYRRVRTVGTEFVECYRFEVRSGYSQPIGEFALRWSDPIRKDVLLQQTEIPESEWLEAHTMFVNMVSEPWDVE